MDPTFFSYFRRMWVISKWKEMTILTIGYQNIYAKMIFYD